jgi:hypothetical protein
MSESSNRDVLRPTPIVRHALPGLLPLRGAVAARLSRDLWLEVRLQFPLSV